MPPSAHSKLGASSAYRWIACPGSVREAAKMPNKSSVYAAEGTAAHALAEHCLTHGYNAERFAGDVVELLEPDGYAIIKNVSADGVKSFPIDDDMVDAVQTYLDAVRAEVGPGDKLVVEKRFHIEALHPAFFGTNDACVYKPKTKELVVFDYKHGQGVPVEVERNKQLMYYGLGAAMEETRPLSRIKLVVVQPRCPHKDGPVRAWETDPVDLMDYSAELIDAAKATEADDAPLNPGDHCKFCPAAPVCPALHQATLAAADVDFGANSGEPILREPNTFDSAELGKLLRQVNTIKVWLKAVEEFANDEAKAGRPPEGFKLVGGKKMRSWKDEEQAKAWLVDYGLGEKDIFTEPKMKSPAQIEKTIGRKNAGDIVDLVAHSSGSTLLVPEDDPREPINPGADADFAPSQSS